MSDEEEAGGSGRCCPAGGLFEPLEMGLLLLNAEIFCGALNVSHHHNSSIASAPPLCAITNHRWKTSKLPDN